MDEFQEIANSGGRFELIHDGNEGVALQYTHSGPGGSALFQAGVSLDGKVKSFLNRMFNRRHVLTHNGGRIDQEYLDSTADTSVLLNQTISVHSKDLKRLLPLLQKCAQNLFEAFETVA
ncbi:MAG: hypothetical protein ACLPRE_12360 [Limisphaerales bacterium]